MMSKEDKQKLRKYQKDYWKIKKYIIKKFIFCVYSIQEE